MKKIAVVAGLLALLFLGACDNSPTEPNDYPQVTSFSGPTFVQVGEQVVFTMSGYDSDGDTVSFQLELHRSRPTETCALTNLDWSPYVDNSELVEQVVTWEFGTGTFFVHCIVRDSNGRTCPEEEHWTKTVTVTD
ncbi:MAG: hypothetical protein GY856_39135 [bacterium]|nr:hypothetical protein [bacterium]